MILVKIIFGIWFVLCRPILRSPYVDSGLTDEQMMETVKSRYLQSPSEVRAWFETLVDKADVVRSDYESLVEEARAAEIAKAAAAASDSAKTE